MAQYSAVTYPMAIATASTFVLPANQRRYYVALINDSDTVIYLALGNFAAVNTGIRLNANGGSYFIDIFNPYTGDIAAIHGGTGNKTLLVVEGGSFG